MNNKINQGSYALFRLGFRPFFFGAAIFSIISISLWSLIYLFQYSIGIDSISESQWHAHEMIYGYVMAVIAGFLLTAIKNWTGIQTIRGKWLAFLFALWAIARLLFLFGTKYIKIAAIFDLSFAILLMIFTSYPIIKVKQWRQSFILIKLLLLFVGNALFYLEAINMFEDRIRISLYGGLYIIIAVILTIGRRITPFFIERGVGYEVKLFNSKWLDFSSMLLFLIFFISELFLENKALSAYLALGLFLVNAIRLVGWHTNGIWGKSLLWSLYLSLWFICFGFLLFSTTYFFDVSEFLAIHLFAFGGIGLITIAMMSRVSLGHTGRNIGSPNNAMKYAFILIIIGTVIRTIIPLFNFFDYKFLIGLAQLCWITSFVIFIIVYSSILIQPRIDGMDG